MRRLMLTAALVLLGCGPKVAPAASGAPVSVAEQAAWVTLAEALDTRSGEGEGAEGYALAADLARILADGEASPEVRDAARELLLWLDDVPLEAPALSPDDPGETAIVPVEPERSEVGTQADARATLRVADRRIERAREHLRAGAFAEAIDALSLLQDSPAWPDAEPYWEEAVNGFVGDERERVGALYVAAKKLPRAERLAALEEVRDLLDGLLAAYPDSVYTEPLEGNLERIERELETMYED